MSIFDFTNFDDDDDPSDEERSEDELKKLKDMLKDGSSKLSNIEALEEIVNYYWENEKYEDALHFINQLLTYIPYSAET
ncbi:MAG TPA: hypothetical protein VNL69_08875, partial [Bacteroidota bacterium]|nr:hypothetical protein [Bacteroidota bacterium]